MLTVDVVILSPGTMQDFSCATVWIRLVFFRFSRTDVWCQFCYHWVCKAVIKMRTCADVCKRTRRRTQIWRRKKLQKAISTSLARASTLKKTIPTCVKNVRQFHRKLFSTTGNGTSRRKIPAEPSRQVINFNPSFSEHLVVEKAITKRGPF